MRHWLKLICTSMVSIVFVGCATSGRFVVPSGAKLYLNDRPVKVQADGKVKTRPFFWTAAGGIPYRLVKNEKTLAEGRLHSKFRAVSIVWPPFALIYWPIGLNPRITYDLVHEKPKGPVTKK